MKGAPFLPLWSINLPPLYFLRIDATSSNKSAASHCCSPDGRNQQTPNLFPCGQTNCCTARYTFPERSLGQLCYFCSCFPSSRYNIEVFPLEPPGTFSESFLRDEATQSSSYFVKAFVLVTCPEGLWAVPWTSVNYIKRIISFSWCLLLFSSFTSHFFCFRNNTLW